MSLALVATGLWFVCANVIAMLPSRDRHWSAAGWLVGVGVPLLGWLTTQHGPVAGMLALALGASVLRWPLVHLMRRMRGQGPRREVVE
jgi:hypothetical protein